MIMINGAARLIYEISRLLDEGKVHTIKEVYYHIEKKDVIDWLAKEYPHPKYYFSEFTGDVKEFLHNELEVVWVNLHDDNYRYYGIANNGLCILLSWTCQVLINNAKEK